MTRNGKRVIPSIGSVQHFSRLIGTEFTICPFLSGSVMAFPKHLFVRGLCLPCKVSNLNTCANVHFEQNYGVVVTFFKKQVYFFFPSFVFAKKLKT